MDDDQQFCLRWNNHQSTLISVFDTLLENGTLVDCTLAAEGKFLKAHKVVLCACSPYFASLLSQQYDKHPIFILKDVKFQELRAMMDYMYRGEVNISQDQLAALLKAAESLQIKGLSDNRSAAKGVDSAQQKQSQVPVSGGAAGSAAKTGLTIEQNKRLRVAADAELSGSREGSTSPSSRKRKKVRRRSVDTNNAVAIDNHDQMSNSSSQSATQQQAQPLTSTPLTLSQITTATSAANVLNVTKKTDNNSNDDDDEEEQTIVRHKTRNTDGSNKDKIDSELLIEPKSEFEDGNDEPVEDLTMGDEDLMEDLEQAGPSHGGEGSSQGYQWQVDRSQDEVYLATQESSGQHRDAQAPEDLSIARIAGLSWDQWSSQIGLPLVTQLREGIHPLLFPTDLTVNPIASAFDDKKSIKLLSPSTHDRSGLNATNTSGSGSSNDQSGGGYSCPAPDCGRVYKLKSSLRNHQKWECGKDPQFQCPFCVYRAKQKMHIGRHMERMHKNNAAMLKAAAAAVVASATAAATGIKREEENSSDEYTASDKE